MAIVPNSAAAAPPPEILQMYAFLRATLANKLLEVYLRSKNSAYQHKRESYLVFKLNLEQFLGDELGALGLLLQCYMQLFHRGESSLPFMHRIERARGILDNRTGEVPELQEYK